MIFLIHENTKIRSTRETTFQDYFDGNVSCKHTRFGSKSDMTGIPIQFSPDRRKKAHRHDIPCVNCISPQNGSFQFLGYRTNQASHKLEHFIV